MDKAIIANAMSERAEEHQRMRFEHMMEDFIERYAPKDPRENAGFQASLHSITRQLFMDVQTPMHNTVHSAISAALATSSAFTTPMFKAPPKG